MTETATPIKAAADKIVELKTGEFVFREGDLGTDMYIIQQGEVEILGRMAGEEKHLATFEKGDFFGEMSLLEELPRAATARARTDVRLVSINGSTFDQMLRSNSEIAVRMMRKLSRRLRETDGLLRQALGNPDATGAPEVPSRQPALDATTQGDGPEILEHEKSGIEFHLAAGTETTIGRSDPVTGIYPEIDLTPVDTQRSISRRHAKIYRRGDKIFLSEEIGTMNGTFRNGERLETGVPVEIGSGDEVRLGLVSLKFRV